MAAQNHVMATVSYGGQEAGFAKIQGEHACYFMRDYSISLGRNNEKYTVDLDLSHFDARMHEVSRHHASIFYDFECRHFTLEVLGRNGCKIQGVTYRPGCDAVKLNSQDLIEIAGSKIYFLLPTRSIYATFAARHTAQLQAQYSSVIPPGNPGHRNNNDSGMRSDPKMQGTLKQRKKKSSRGGGSNISDSKDVSADATGGAPGGYGTTDGGKPTS